MSRSRARRHWLRGIGALVALALIAVAIATPFYRFPATDQPAPVDVVYVIGPPTDARIEVAEDMVDQGLAGAMMISVSEVESWYVAASDACTESRDYPVFCARPDPFTTRGEARWLEDLAEKEGWSSAAVVTFTPHISRTRVVMDRCFGGELLMLDSGEELGLREWAFQYVYQTAGFVKVAAMQSC